jgi:hypothetical protein
VLLDHYGSVMSLLAMTESKEVCLDFRRFEATGGDNVTIPLPVADKTVLLHFDNGKHGRGHCFYVVSRAV